MVNISIKDIRKSFGENVAVDIDSFVINTGDILGLVGNNGAGKTTLFRLMLDLLQADQGEVEITETAAPEQTEQPVVINPAASEAWKQFTGAYIDEGFLIEFLTPEEYFQFVGQASGIPSAEVEERLKVYEHFMQGEVLGQKKLIRDLSAGNKQKVGIVGALLTQPKLLILDEPFNFLDPSSQVILKHLITDYHQATKATILISSHNLQHTVEISTRVALLEHGHIVKDLPNNEGSANQELAEYFGI
ncbi:MAG: ABC transporter ATP-binding protein [Prevotella sp.]|nr:ABC transporter ATP-binding protein [Prevotella sp.]